MKILLCHKLWLRLDVVCRCMALCWSLAVQNLFNCLPTFYLPSFSYTRVTVMTIQSNLFHTDTKGTEPSEAGLLVHYCKHWVRDKTNLKAVDTRTPTHLLASLSYWIYWRTDRQKCWSAFPAHAVGELPCSFPPTAPIRVVLSWHSKECFLLALAGNGLWTREL